MSFKVYSEMRPAKCSLKASDQGFHLASLNKISVTLLRAKIRCQKETPRDACSWSHFQKTPPVGQRSLGQQRIHRLGYRSHPDIRWSPDFFGSFLDGREWYECSSPPTIGPLGFYLRTHEKSHSGATSFFEAYCSGNDCCSGAGARLHMFQCDARVLGLCRFKGLLIHISFFGHRNPAKWPTWDRLGKRRSRSFCNWSLRGALRIASVKPRFFNPDTWWIRMGPCQMYL